MPASIMLDTLVQSPQYRIETLPPSPQAHQMKTQECLNDLLLSCFLL